MKTKKIPMRTCVGCHESKKKIELMRVIKTPEGEIVFDSTGRKNGRGAYICPSAECLYKARKSGSIERSLGVTVPDEVYDIIERQMLALDKE